MEKSWHPKFIEYMEYIVNHPNYRGLPYSRDRDGNITWIAPKTQEIGRKRIAWCIEKAKELGIDPESPGLYAKVMFAIHPTKTKVCQICGRSMSLYYIYPNKWLKSAIQEEFDYEVDDIQDMYEIATDLTNLGNDEKKIKQLLIKKFKLASSYLSKDLDEIIESGERNCREGNCSAMGPGAMSNFPDRYDGFHTYNRCCRATEDTGRHPDNMRSYNKDRRAYENWSDGNIHAANKFMSSSFFKGTSADHLGPISLGFIHDSHYLRPLSKGDNSTKRDRLLRSDIEKIIEIEEKTGISPINWYSRNIWEYIKLNYQSHPNKLDIYRDGLKQNVNDFLSLLYIIVSNTGDAGKTFLTHSYIRPKLNDFKYDYTFDKDGNILSKVDRRENDANRKEATRYIRISFESIEEYADKDNRHLKESFNPNDSRILSLCREIKVNPSNLHTKVMFEDLVHTLERNTIKKIDEA